MRWILFDTYDRETPAPNFCLDSVKGEQVCLKDYQEECSIVLIFTHGSQCTTCEEMLKSFAGRQGDYRESDAVVLAVVPEPIEAISTDSFYRDLPFDVVFDENSIVRKSFSELMDESMTNDEDTMLFVLDSYAAPYAALIGPELIAEGIPATGMEASQSREDELHYEAIKWLEFIGIQCPE